MIMFRLFISLLYISVIAVLASCGDGEAARGVLRRADSLMEEHTDSAMALLRRDSVILVHAPKLERMAYILSRTEAEDKLYITHRSDSAMQLAVKYFDRHGTALQRTRAWYLLGRVYCDMLLYGNALTAFDAVRALPCSLMTTQLSVAIKPAPALGQVLFMKRKIFINRTCAIIKWRMIMLVRLTYQQCLFILCVI